ncbi:heat-shock protein [Spirochaetia bacterium]|nr:heat-shock protein [Spirochaetia bacterium]
MKTVSGIDFGTANSTVSYIGQDRQSHLVDVENNEKIIPTTLFFYKDSNKILYGNAAIETFLKREVGRFIGSIKSILGTSLMDGKTRINNRNVEIRTLIACFIRHLKAKLDNQTETNVESVVIGRPVRFNDYDEKMDAQAQILLRDIAYDAGFKYIEFQYEPVAAAFSHERHIQGEKLALVIDIGGGTSDFTIIKIGGDLKDKMDRTKDILSNTGVKIGGNAFDKDLSFNAFMSELGKNTTTDGMRNLPMPSYIFAELSDWNGINFIYTQKNIHEINEIYRHANDKEKVGRLVELVNSERAHELLRIAEQAKIELTYSEKVSKVLTPVKDSPAIGIMRTEFDNFTASNIARIQKSLSECLTQAGMNGSDIDLVVLTGGSTSLISIRNLVHKTFPNAILSAENKFSAVGEGLAYDAYQRFSQY